eukprot:CAMPEP_0177578210 /NCGR_PEP_ID=MMETSP0419_2-20121207/221_1 /TAXON_ID=582737 /ORGANISM="Tetraselmis sp., Strain GSL018" /LENGTH=187 /DNA_ID=CAMNT_0019066627 /DNA_START=1033 /DNA_END=1596 /DNA_ORIENTATION=-
MGPRAAGNRGRTPVARPPGRRPKAGASPQASASGRRRLAARTPRRPLPRHFSKCGANRPATIARPQLVQSTRSEATTGCCWPKTSSETLLKAVAVEKAVAPVLPVCGSFSIADPSQVAAACVFLESIATSNSKASKRSEYTATVCAATDVSIESCALSLFTRWTRSFHITKSPASSVICEDTSIPEF